MRCKWCDKKLEPSQYYWDEEAKEFKETCGGRCVLSNDDLNDMLLQETKEEEVTNEVVGAVLWVP